MFRNTNFGILSSENVGGFWFLYDLVFGYEKKCNFASKISFVFNGLENK